MYGRAMVSTGSASRRLLRVLDSAFCGFQLKSRAFLGVVVIAAEVEGVVENRIAWIRLK
jgi:hypothetical protein